MTATIQQEAMGMRYLDSSRPSPMAGTVTEMFTAWPVRDLVYLAEKIDELLADKGYRRPVVATADHSEVQA